MENLKLIQKIARSFSITTGVDFDDLFQEACIAYLEAVKTHDMSRGKLSTHMWYCIHNRLKNYVKEEQKHVTVSIEETEIEIEMKTVLEDGLYFENLSTEAQTIVATLLDSIEDFVCRPQKDAQMRVQKMLVAKGVPLPKIFRGFRDLQRLYA